MRVRDAFILIVATLLMILLFWTFQTVNVLNNRNVPAGMYPATPIELLKDETNWPGRQYVSGLPYGHGGAYDGWHLGGGGYGGWHPGGKYGGSNPDAPQISPLLPLSVIHPAKQDSRQSASTADATYYFKTEADKKKAMSASK